MITKTCYEMIEEVAKIKSKDDRKDKIRALVIEYPGIAIMLQHAYHPDVEYDLPPEDPSPEVMTRVAHGEALPMLQASKRLYQFMKTFEMNKSTREMNFIQMCESVDEKDVDLLLGIKNKKLPFRGMNEDFVTWAIPELFPPKE